MSYSLTYSISRKTPPSAKALKEILSAQGAVNAACSWSHERLSLAAPQEARPVLTFPFTRFGFASGPMTLHADGLVPREPAADAFAQGTTRVRNNAWNAHVVAAFWRTVSRLHPQLLIELRDEGGFVIPGSVWIRGGNVEVNRAYLNQERARALELTGDPRAAEPYVLAELHGLAGHFFADGPVVEYAEVPEIQNLDLNWQELEAMSISDVAQRFVEGAIKAPVGAAA